MASSIFLNLGPICKKVHFTILKHFEDGKTGMYWSLYLSGPKILKTFLDFMLNPGIATKNIVLVEEVWIFLEVVIRLATLVSWNIPEYHVSRKSRSWEIPSTSVQCTYPKFQNSKTSELLIEIHLIIERVRSYLFDQISYHIFKEEQMTTDFF